MIPLEKESGMKAGDFGVGIVRKSDARQVSTIGNIW